MSVNILCHDEIYANGLALLLQTRNITSRILMYRNRIQFIMELKTLPGNSLLVLDCKWANELPDRLNEVRGEIMLNVGILMQKERAHVIRKISPLQLKMAVPMEDIVEIEHGVQQFYSGRVYIHHSYLSSIWENRNTYIRIEEENPLLVEKEIAILQLLFLEFSAKQIADRLCMSTRTVEWHKSKMMEKTGSKNVVGLIRYGLENDLLRISSIEKELSA